MKKLIKMIILTINGCRFNGESISINKNKILIDGEDVTPDTKEINIVFESDINKLTVADCNSIHITGDCGALQSLNGDIDVFGDVVGNISTVHGDVDCGDVLGKVKTKRGNVYIN